MSEITPTPGGEQPFDRRVILAVALSLAILIGWQVLFPPPKPTPTPTPPPAVEEPRGERVEPADELETAAPAADELPTPSERTEATAEERLVVETDLFRVELSNRGGRALSWGLRDYATAAGEPLELVPRLVGGDSRYLTLVVDAPGLTDEMDDALWAVERERRGGAERVRFRWADGRGLEAEKVFTFHDGSYLVDAEVSVRDRGRELPARLVFGPGFAVQDVSRSQSNYYYDGHGVWLVGRDVDRRKKRALVKEEGAIAGPVRWAGLNDQYFAALVLPADDEPARIAWRAEPVVRVDAGDGGEASAEPIVSVSVGERGAQLFVGPKKYTLLRDAERDLDRAIWFSSMNWLVPIVKTIFRGLLWLHDHTVPNYGFAIILATFILRLLLFPVNQYAMVSMKKTQLQMGKLQPKMKAIRAKFKKAKTAEERARMNQEMMALYKQEGVNPMGGLNGCLPLLAQFPILIGFYNMLTVAVELRGAPFILWIADLSVKDPFYFLPLAMGATMFVQQKLAMTKIKDPQQLQQQKIMQFMPVMFTVICVQLPAGMVLYWFVNNLLGIGQQWLVNRQTERLELAHKNA